MNRLYITPSFALCEMLLSLFSPPFGMGSKAQFAFEAIAMIHWKSFVEAIEDVRGHCYKLQEERTAKTS